MIDNYKSIFFGKGKEYKIEDLFITVRFKASDFKILPMKSNATLKMTLLLGSTSGLYVWALPLCALTSFVTN